RRGSALFLPGTPTGRPGRGGPSPQEALARLRETEEMLSKKQEYLETRIERELAAARQHGTKNNPLFVYSELCFSLNISKQ
uniref:Uncharacterized protein n=1 Tax=Strix occidentalis caurina TaxID=311401 RepID=A0A8D0FDA0_STROC